MRLGSQGVSPVRHWVGAARSCAAADRVLSRAGHGRDQVIFSREKTQLDERIREVTGAPLVKRGVMSGAKCGTKNAEEQQAGDQWEFAVFSDKRSCLRVSGCKVAYSPGSQNTKTTRIATVEGHEVEHALQRVKVAGSA